MSEEFFNKARKIARDIDRGTYMKETDEYKVCSLEEAEAFTKKRRKVSIRTVENTIGLARSVANGTTKFPFMGYCADLMEKMLEEIKEARKAQEK